ncbi:MAG: hypothetical protein K5Q68_07685 [Roseococcus sp.]|nr:hypothetical protein [Roseococcus sp.]
MSSTRFIERDAAGWSNNTVRVIAPIVEPMIPGNRWYLFANAETAPVYVYGFLDGAEAPQVSTGPIQGVDALEITVVFDFGVGAVDWRGGWFNPGN